MKYMDENGPDKMRVMLHQTTVEVKNLTEGNKLLLILILFNITIFSSIIIRIKLKIICSEKS